MASGTNIILLLIVLIGLDEQRRAVRANSIFTKSEDEEAALVEFRTLTEDLAYREFMKDDGYLIRWLIDTDFDVHKALEEFENFVEWRKENEIDTLVLEDFSTIDQELEFWFDGFDKEGRVLCMTSLGRWDVRKIILGGEEEMYQKFLIRMYEIGEVYLHLLRTTMNRPNTTQILIIHDFSGWNLKTGGCFKCVAQIPEVVINFFKYPQLFIKSVLVNTPTIFNKPLQLVRRLMPENRKDAVTVYGHDKAAWAAELHKEIDADQLPIEFGGTRPSLYTKSSKIAHAKRMADLLAKTQKIVLRDLDMLSDSDSHTQHEDISANWTESGSDYGDLKLPTEALILTEAPAPKILGATEVENQTAHVHRHHHHYQRPPQGESLNTGQYKIKFKSKSPVRRAKPKANGSSTGNELRFRRFMTTIISIGYILSAH